MTGIEVTHDPEIPVRLVQLWLCDLCLDGEGEECHTPGCSLWIHDVPKPALRGSQGVTILDAAPQPAPELAGTVTIDGQTLPQATPPASTELAAELAIELAIERGTVDVLARAVCDVWNASEDGSDVPDSVHAALDRLGGEQPAPELATVQEALAVAFGMLQMVTLGTDDLMAAQARKAVDLVKEILSGGVTVPEAKPSPELAELRAKHKKFLNEILGALEPDAGSDQDEQKDAGESSEDFAIRLAHYRNERITGLYAQIATPEPLSVKPTDDVKPAPELAAAMVAEVAAADLLRRRLAALITDWRSEAGYGPGGSYDDALRACANSVHTVLEQP